MSTTSGWLDSTLTLYWISNNSKEWKQFVSRRVIKNNQDRIKKDKNLKKIKKAINEERDNLETLSDKRQPLSKKDNSTDISSKTNTHFHIFSLMNQSGLARNNIIQPHHKKFKEGCKMLKQIHLPTITTVECQLKQISIKFNLSKIPIVKAWINGIVMSFHQKKKKEKKIFFFRDCN